jgi:metal-responsive CopG/Arc/MetJ family transcriptional regulator
MGESKAISIRIPDELLAKVNKLAEEKYKSIAGKPNKSLVIQNALVAYFDTLSDSVSNEKIVTVHDTVSIVNFKQLQDFVATLSKDVEQMRRLISESSSVDILPELMVKVEPKQVTKHQLELSPLSTVSDTVDSGLTGKQLSERLNCKYAYLNSKKNEWKENPSKFADWSSGVDPDGHGWRPIEGKSKHALRYHRIEKPASLSEGEAEAQTNHP